MYQSTGANAAGLWRGGNVTLSELFQEEAFGARSVSFGEQSVR
jgi:hypothetical protein